MKRAKKIKEIKPEYNEWFIHPLDLYKRRMKKFKRIVKNEIYLYKFNGSGEYSDYYDWDNGISCHLECVFPYSVAMEIQIDMIRYNGWSFGLPFEAKDLEVGVYYTGDEYGGSRRYFGYICARSKREAKYFLKKFEEKFPIREYRPEN